MVEGRRVRKEQGFRWGLKKLTAYAMSYSYYLDALVSGKQVEVLTLPAVFLRDKIL